MSSHSRTPRPEELDALLLAPNAVSAPHALIPAAELAQLRSEAGKAATALLAMVAILDRQPISYPATAAPAGDSTP